MLSVLSFSSIIAYCLSTTNQHYSRLLCYLFVENISVQGTMWKENCL